MWDFDDILEALEELLLGGLSLVMSTTLYAFVILPLGLLGYGIVLGVLILATTYPLVLLLICLVLYPFWKILRHRHELRNLPVREMFIRGRQVVSQVTTTALAVWTRRDSAPLPGQPESPPARDLNLSQSLTKLGSEHKND